MPKPSGDSGVRAKALFLTPESPDPPVGGGAMRSASLLEYLRSRFEVDVVTFAESVPGSMQIALPHHSQSAAAKAWRNGRRFALGRPPLLDRYSGFGEELRALVEGRSYDFAVIEHFWCAPYAEALRPFARRLVLDLHNMESALASTFAGSQRWPLTGMHRRFARSYEALERKWLPGFDAVLTTSEREAAAVRALGARGVVYPNTIRCRPAPEVAREEAIIFTGNLEYHPNVAAIRWFARKIWPSIHARRPGLEWRVVGTNPHAVARELRSLDGVRLVGPVEDAIAELARAKVAVVPLLAGSGTRFKILEAWCAGTAVVSTTIGAEGLEAVAGRDLAIADGAGEFAGAVAWLMENQAERESMALRGRGLLERSYTTARGWEMLDQSKVFDFFNNSQIGLSGDTLRF
jgi:glycosyltransferase involved in cell wall biosynthesis